MSVRSDPLLDQDNGASAPCPQLGALALNLGGSMGIADRLFLLFRSNENIHGTYLPGDPDPVTGKEKGDSHLLPGPLTPALWQRHLEGIEGVGPVLIFEERKVLLGVIDVDGYKKTDIRIPPEEIASRIEGTPFIPCQSKSGGWHLYLFTNEPVEAKLMRAALISAAIKFGVGGSEIFPGQDVLTSGNKGSYINGPYFGGSRVCFDGGRPLTVEQFLDLVETRRVSPSYLMRESGFEAEREKRKTTRVKEQAKLFTDGPPCLEIMIANGLQAGTRNTVCLNVAVYLKSRFGEAFPEHLRKWIDEANLGADFDSKEVDGIIRSVGRSEYRYQCKVEPLVSHCKSMICRLRPHGVGAGETLPIITDAILLRGEMLPQGRTSAVYQLYFEGEDEPLLFTPDDLGGYRQFRNALLAQRPMPLPLVKNPEFLAYINDAISRATVDRDRSALEIDLQQGVHAVRSAVRHVAESAVVGDAEYAIRYGAVVIEEGVEGKVLLPHFAIATTVTRLGSGTLTPNLLHRALRALKLELIEYSGVSAWRMTLDTTKLRLARSARPETEDPDFNFLDD